MCMQSHNEIILTGETEELGEKPVPVPFDNTYLMFDF
jgi:hypothetical protein